MTIEAELADGRILEFPDGTSPQVIQNAVKSMMGQSQPAPQKEQNVLQAAASRPAIDPVGVLEGVGNVVSGLGSSAVGGLRGLGTLATGGSLEQAVKNIQGIQEKGTYQPRTQSGSLVAKLFNLPMEVAADVTRPVGASIGKVLGNEAAGETIGENLPAVLGTLAMGKAPVKSIATTPYEGVGLPALKSVAEQGAPAAAVRAQAVQEAAQAASAKDWQSSARIDTVKEAQALPHPPALNPAMANPTVSNRVNAALSGSSGVDVAMSKANKNVWGNNAKADMGIDVNTPLTSDAPFKAVRAKAAKPYAEISKLGELIPDETVVGDISKVTVPDLISDPNAAPKVQSLVDTALAKIEKGMTGAEALEQIKQLRADADVINSAKAKGTKVDPSDTAKANASLEIANALESLIEKNIPETQPKLLTDFKKARVDIAKSYAYQKATNLDTGYLDPSKLPDNMTGIGATMRKVAANFPDAANVDPSFLGKLGTHLSRVGPAGATGFAVGSMMGAPYLGSIIGAGVGEIGGLLNAKRMTGRSFQESNVIPKDRRIPLNGMLTGEE